MQFLTPLFWLAAAGIGLPVLIHLVRRERAQVLLFSSLRFLRPITRKSFKYMNLRNPWVLLLRVLLVLLIVSAFARPFFPGANPVLSDANAATATVILLDNSYSMTAGGRFERARTQAADYVSRLGAQDEAALVTFSDGPTVLAGFNRDHGVLKSLLQSKAVPSFRMTDYVAALRSADKLLSDRTGVKRSIVMFSDFQKAGFRREDSFRLSPGVHLEPVSVTGGDSVQVVVSEAHVDLTGRSPKRVGKVSARLLSLIHPAPATEVTLLLNGRRETAQPVVFGAESVKSAEIGNIGWPEGSVRGEVQARAGSSSASFFVVAEGHAREEVAVIEGPAVRGGQTSAYYLARALASSEGETFATRVVSASQAGDLALRNFRAIFIVGVESLPADLVRRLKDAASEGTGLVFSLSPSVSPAAFNTAFAELIPARLEAAVPREREPVGVLGNIKYNHPIFKVFSETRTGNFLASRFHGYVGSKPDAGAQVLARFDDGSPALIERSMGRGRVLLFTSSLDNSWNDLPLNPAYLPLINQMVTYSGSLSAQRSWYWVGESMPVVDRGPVAGGDVSRVPGTYVTTPASNGAELPVRDAVYTFDQPGFYSFRTNENISYRAANVRPEELDLTPLNTEEFVAAITAPAVAPADDDKSPQSPKEKQPESEFGLYLLGLALLVLFAEVAIANRSVRQVF